MQSPARFQKKSRKRISSLDSLFSYETLEPRHLLSGTTQTFIYWSEGPSIYRSLVDGSGSEVIATNTGNQGQMKFDINTSSERLITASFSVPDQNDGSWIYSYDFAGNDRTLIRDTGWPLGVVPQSITVNPDNNDIYYSPHVLEDYHPNNRDPNTTDRPGGMQLLSSDGSSLTTFDQRPWYVDDMEVDSVNGHVYYTVHPSFGGAPTGFAGIHRMNLDGSGDIAILETGGASWLALDIDRGHFYYGENTLGDGNADGKTIYRSNLDGSNLQTIVEDTGYFVADIDYDWLEERLIFQAFDGTENHVVSVNLDGSDQQTLFSTGVGTSPIAIVYVYPNEPPTIDPANDLVVNDATAEQTVNLTGITDGNLGNQPLLVSATSSNTALIPTPAVEYSWPNSTGTLQFTAAAGQFGTATITVTVEDGGNDKDLNTASDNLTTSQTFRVTVNIPPNLDYLPDRITIQNSPDQIYLLTGITYRGEGNQPLAVTATTNNPNLITRLQVDYSSPETTGQLSFKPRHNRHGEADITVTVMDGGIDNLLSTTEDNTIFHRTFRVTVKEVSDMENVKFVLDEGLNSTSDQWFVGTTSRTGTLTAEVGFKPSKGDAQIALYNSAGQYVSEGLATSEGRRLDYNLSQGEIFYLQLTGNNPDVDLKVVNLLTINGSDVLIGGSDESDSFVFNAARTTRVTINEVVYKFDSSSVNRFYIDGSRGNNTIWFGATSGDETVDFNHNNVQIVGPNWSPVFGSGYVAQLMNLSSVTFRGRGGEDTANFHGTSASETYNSNGDIAYMMGPGYTHMAREMTSMTAYAGGGYDEAFLRDSNGDDLYETYSDRAVMTAGGYHSVASGFDRTTGRATSGQDTVVSHDSNGNDLLYSYDDRVILAGPGYNNTAIGFDVNRTMASGQAGDIAYLFDSAGNDSLMAYPDSTSLNRAGRESTAENFSAVYAYASSGNDTADFYDSVGNDKYHGYLDRTRMTGDGLFYWARGFDSMTGHFSDGHDKAYLFDSPGNDQFVGGASDATMTDGAVTNRAMGYDTVNAYSRDGSDTATLHDSSGDELFRAYADRSVMHGTEMHCWVGGFETVTAHSSGGNDSARLLDTAGNDHFYSYANWAFLTGNGYRNEAVGFGQTTVFGSGGFDRAHMDDSVGNDTVKARAVGPKLTQGDGTIFDVRQFDRILARSVNGGEDIAEFVEFDYDFELEGDWNN